VGDLNLVALGRLFVLSRQIIVTFLLFWLQCAFAVDLNREQEIAQCLPGEISTWGDGQDRQAVTSPLMFVYKHDDAPAWFDEKLVLSMITKAATAWSECGVPSWALRRSADASIGAVLVHWSEEGSRRNFGLANIGNRTLTLGPAAFGLLKTRNPAFDANQTLQMVISHEMGHLFGLMAHSKRCADVTSYYNNGKGESCSIRGGGKLQPGVEYRSLMPTACDIQRCRTANAEPSTPK